MSEEQVWKAEKQAWQSGLPVVDGKYWCALVSEGNKVMTFATTVATAPGNPGQTKKVCAVPFLRNSDGESLHEVKGLTHPIFRRSVWMKVPEGADSSILPTPPALHEMPKGDKKKPIHISVRRNDVVLPENELGPISNKLPRPDVSANQKQAMLDFLDNTGKVDMSKKTDEKGDK